MLSAVRKLVLQQLQSPAATAGAKRGMAGHYAPIPKPDTSMDHVFGDSSYRLPAECFEPPSMGKVFGMTVVAMGVFGFPIWVYVYEDYKMQVFKDQ
eukprot:gene16479-22701_t